MTQRFHLSFLEGAAAKFLSFLLFVGLRVNAIVDLDEFLVFHGVFLGSFLCDCTYVWDVEVRVQSVIKNYTMMHVKSAIY